MARYESSRAFLDAQNSRFNDNTTGEITPARVRSQASDIRDNYLFREDLSHNSPYTFTPNNGDSRLFGNAMGLISVSFPFTWRYTNRTDNIALLGITGEIFTERQGYARVDGMVSSSDTGVFGSGTIANDVAGTTLIDVFVGNVSTVDSADSALRHDSVTFLFRTNVSQETATFGRPRTDGSDGVTGNSTVCIWFRPLRNVTVSNSPLPLTLNTPSTAIARNNVRLLFSSQFRRFNLHAFQTSRMGLAPLFET